jgi:hypothetical protein
MKTFAELHTGAALDTEALDLSWEKRRALARDLRQLAELLVSTDGAAEHYDEACAHVAQARAQLELLPRKRGLLAHTQLLGVARFVAVAREINPFYGLANPLAPPLEMWRDDTRAYGRTRLGYAYEGPPGHVHGGFIAALFDQFLGFAQTLSGKSGMTGKLQVRYTLPTPLDAALSFEAQIKEQVGRLTYVEGRMTAEGTLTAKAKALFVEISPTYLVRSADK